LVLAGILRKILRYCVNNFKAKGRALFKLGELILLLNLDKLRIFAFNKEYLLIYYL